MNNMKIEEIVLEIKRKEELSGISSIIVRESLERYIKKNKINLERLSKFYIKTIIKEIRSELRLLAGRFENIKIKAEDLENEESIIKLLRSHMSTSERLEDYSILRKLIYDLSPKSILDLGCGINPIALAKPEINYYAADINESDINLVNYYFKKKGISGKAFFYDLRKIKSDLPETDLCLLLKVFDVLERRGHKLAEKIILSVKSRYIIASFSTKTLSGKAMRHPQRGWIEQMLNRLHFSFQIYKTGNEIFYIIKN